jgi:hypothetical protein
MKGIRGTGRPMDRVEDRKLHKLSSNTPEAPEFRGQWRRCTLALHRILARMRGLTQLYCVEVDCALWATAGAPAD